MVTIVMMMEMVTYEDDAGYVVADNDVDVNDNDDTEDNERQKEYDSDKDDFVGASSASRYSNIKVSRFATVNYSFLQSK